MSPLALLWLALAVPGDAPVPAGFVFSPTIALVVNPLAPIPSGELSLFFGGALPVRSRRPGHWFALGYRGTVGGGFADYLTTGDRLYLIAHRHHLAFQGVAGEHGRLVYAADLGLSAHHGALHDEGEPVPPPRALAIEVEARIGRVLGYRNPAHLQGVVGLQIRLAGAVWPFTAAPLPTLGLFFGLQFGRRVPIPPPRSQHHAPYVPPDADGDGLADPLDRCPRDAGGDPVGCPELDTDPDGTFELPPAPRR